MSELSTIELIYWASTIIGGTLFVLRTMMLVAGGGFGEGDFDADFDGDIDASFDEIDHSATDASFKLLSMQGLTAFFMMFGLVGLALFHTGLHVSITVLGGTIAGLSAVWLMGLVFRAMLGLQSDGTLDIQNAVGQVGEVYLTIPAKGTGQVSVVVQGSLRIFDAMSANKKKIATGEKIKVVEVISGNLLLVESLH